MVSSPVSARLLQPRQGGTEYGGDRHADEERADPRPPPRYQVLVDKDPREDRWEQPSHHEYQAGQQHVKEPGPGTAEAVAEGSDQAATGPAGPEVRLRLQRQDHSREALPELGFAHNPGACRRVVQEHLPGGEPLDYHEVVEFQNTINGSRKASRSSGCWLSPLHFRP